MYSPIQQPNMLLQHFQNFNGTHHLNQQTPQYQPRLQDQSQMQQVQLMANRPKIQYSQIKYQGPKPQEVEVIHRYPVFHEVHHIERVPQFIPIEDVVKPWREKYLSLCRDLVDLQIQFAYPKDLFQEDNSKLNSLVAQEIELQQQIRFRYFQTNRDKDEQIYQLNQQVSENEALQFETNQETTTLTTELDTMKSSFITLNKKFHQVQEELMFKQVELESLKQKKSGNQSRKHSTLQNSLVSFDQKKHH